MQHNDCNACPPLQSVTPSPKESEHAKMAIDFVARTVHSALSMQVGGRARG